MPERFMQILYAGVTNLVVGLMYRSIGIKTSGDSIIRFYNQTMEQKHNQVPCVETSLEWWFLHFKNSSPGLMYNSRAFITANQCVLDEFDENSEVSIR